ncbi:hypothetical protein Micbo1qcDRAFT_234036 [Microdochium bolleyi]|uniref:Uncharacterized protein n=1 Tax=Microdochium bolleyi TaxID=196109 RepID=A0A136J399_9PEZI|nr:hypothetical protein Micbo1qcDRAFT_234036 [Microdochium bolleyi]
MSDDNDAMLTSFLDAIEEGEDAFSIPTDGMVLQQIQARKIITAVALVQEHEELLEKQLHNEFAKISREAVREQTKEAESRKKYRKQATRAKQQLNSMRDSESSGTSTSARRAMLGVLQTLAVELLHGKQELGSMKKETPVPEAHGAHRQSRTLSVGSLPEQRLPSTSKSDKGEDEEEPHPSLRGSKRHSPDNEIIKATPKKPRLQLAQPVDDSPYYDMNEDIPGVAPVDDDDEQSDYGAAYTPMPLWRRSKRASTATTVSPAASRLGEDDTRGSRRRSTKTSTYNERAYYKSIGV